MKNEGLKEKSGRQKESRNKSAWVGVGLGRMVLDENRPDQLRGLLPAVTNHSTRNQMLWKLPRSQRHQRINGISHRWFSRHLRRNEWSGTVREPLFTAP